MWEPLTPRSPPSETDTSIQACRPGTTRRLSKSKRSAIISTKTTTIPKYNSFTIEKEYPDTANSRYAHDFRVGMLDLLKWLDQFPGDGGYCYAIPKLRSLGVTSVVHLWLLTLRSEDYLASFFHELVQEPDGLKPLHRNRIRRAVIYWKLTSCPTSECV
jgi:hypothetical protein